LCKSCFRNGSSEVAIIGAAVSGALFGFLRYNKPKAQVFMGDTGSLALGGLLGTLAVMGKFEILLILIGEVFVAETLSVIIQVISFKTTGKRVFKMSPVHHHFELCNWSEKKIVVVFALTSALLCAIAVILNIKGII
jgi:phospho-N-acetylmuramoyl-pentapeptide-transferase